MSSVNHEDTGRVESENIGSVGGCDVVLVIKICRLFTDSNMTERVVGHTFQQTRSLLETPCKVSLPGSQQHADIPRILRETHDLVYYNDHDIWPTFLH